MSWSIVILGALVVFVLLAPWAPVLNWVKFNNNSDVLGLVFGGLSLVLFVSWIALVTIWYSASQYANTEYFALYKHQAIVGTIVIAIGNAYVFAVLEYSDHVRRKELTKPNHGSVRLG